MTIKNLIEIIGNNGECKNIEIKKYLSIKEKDFVLRKFMIKYSLKDLMGCDPVSISVEAEMMYLFYILFAFTDIEVDEEDITFENYDLIKKSDFTQYLKHEIGEDYYILLNMAKECVSIKNISEIYQVLSLFNSDKFKDELDAFKKMIENVNINEINKLLVFNNPLLKNIIR